ncbi:MAG: hypothetical protein AMXMBFR13_32590 [Phycisphaerae bacterium]
MPFVFRSLRAAMPLHVMGLSAFLLLADYARADWREEIGLNSLQRRLGGAAPTGAGIAATQVEMSEDSAGDYLPDASDAQFAGKTINIRSGESGSSNHATVVARYYFGLSSPARSIKRTDIFEANEWSSAILRVGSSREPLQEPHPVQNHSWVGSLRDSRMDADALRRLDLLVQRDGVVVAAGVNNGGHTRMPQLMCSAYNAIAVGLTSADSSHGPTRAEVSGRVKPDIVAPLDATSWATPVVAASAALLLESADELQALQRLELSQRRPARALLVKALLMGGATKDEWPDWRRGLTEPCTDGTVPLDYRYGAGELNLDNSHRILSGGEFEPSPGRLAPLAAWDYDRIQPGAARQYWLEVPASRALHRVSILAAWNRQIHVRAGASLTLVPELADVDLRLYRMESAAPASLVDASVSRIDNVEHIFQPALATGRYVIEVRTDRPVEYCLTWHVSAAAP